MPKTKIDHRTVAAVAEELVPLLKPVCQRVQIAGSMRRRLAQVSDLELLCLPRYQATFFGQQSLLPDVMGAQEDLLQRQLDQMVEAGELAYRFNTRGQKTYGPLNKLLVHVKSEVPVDIFSADEKNWGMALLVRTGPAAFNIAVMSRLKQLGLRGHAYGGITDGVGHDVECPDEETVFRCLRWEYVEPWNRL